MQCPKICDSCWKLIISRRLKPMLIYQIYLNHCPNQKWCLQYLVILSKISAWPRAFPMKMDGCVFIWILFMIRQHWLEKWLSPSGDKPLPEPVLTKIRNTQYIITSIISNTKFKCLHSWNHTGVYSALWLLMPWCISTRALVSTMLTKYPLCRTSFIQKYYTYREQHYKIIFKKKNPLIEGLRMKIQWMKHSHHFGLQQGYPHHHGQSHFQFIR